MRSRDEDAQSRLPGTMWLATTRYCLLLVALVLVLRPAASQSAPRQESAEEKLRRTARSAKAYHVGWRVFTAIMLDTKRLRKAYSIAFHVQSVVLTQRLITLINIPKFRPVGPTGPEVRLVIDFFDDDDRKLATYVASPNYLTTEDFKRGRKIDQAFRDVFELKLPRFKP